MKRIIYIILALLISYGCKAQIEQASKSVFTLTTFKKDGSILASSHGVFVGANGIAISTWAPFVGADHAVVVDAKGNQMDVSSLIGANEIYDVCKFKVNGTTSPSAIAKVPLKSGDKVWIISYSVQEPKIDQRNIQNVETFQNSYAYYSLSSNMPDNSNSCPLVNSRGEVIGLLQHSKDLSHTYATDAQYAYSFQVTNAFALSDAVMKQCSIPVEFPDKLDQASVMLALSQEQTDSVTHLKYINNFIQQFPKATDGYTALAQEQISNNDFTAANNTMNKAVNIVDKKDEAHSAFSRLIYQKEIYKSNMPYASWSLDKALEEAKKAYEINPQPVYQHQQAQIIFAQGQYQTAYDMFIKLSTSSIRNGELFYEAAQCKTQLKAPNSEILALLDSAIAVSPHPLNQIGAPYVLARGTQYFNMGEYRKAVNDFNQYDSLMLGRPITSEFYYTREKAEMQIHQYQQALNDITRAVVMSRDSPLLWAEKASLHLRFNQPKQAIDCANIVIKLAPENTDAYIILGVAQMIQNNKAEGLKALNKAKELGDPRADEYLKKYK